MNGAATSLPRRVAGGLIEIIGPSHTQFGKYDVYLTPGGSGFVVLPMPGWGETEAQREQVIVEDVWSGLQDFLRAAAAEQGRNFVTVSVGMDTLAHLFGQRVLTQADLLDTNLTPFNGGTWQITLGPRQGRDDELTIRFCPDWDGTVTAGNRSAR
jgi:hypothetical protein